MTQKSLEVIEKTAGGSLGGQEAGFESEALKPKFGPIGTNAEFQPQIGENRQLVRNQSSLRHFFIY